MHTQCCSSRSRHTWRPACHADTSVQAATLDLAVQGPKRPPLSLHHRKEPAAAMRRELQGAPVRRLLDRGLWAAVNGFPHSACPQRQPLAPLTVEAQTVALPWPQPPPRAHASCPAEAAGLEIYVCLNRGRPGRPAAGAPRPTLHVRGFAGQGVEGLSTSASAGSGPDHSACRRIPMMQRSFS
jgi:hypothetical protein